MEGDSLDKRYSIRSYLKKRNYKIAQVSIDTGDWEFNDAFIRCKEKNKNQEIDQIVERYIQNAIEQVKYNNSLAKFIYGENKKTPQVLLVHYNPINAYYLNSLIEKLKKSNVKFVPAANSFNNDIFQEDYPIAMSIGLPYYEQMRRSRKLEFKDYPFPAKYKKFLNEQCTQ
jgi:hypothetical protein